MFKINYLSVYLKKLEKKSKLSLKGTKKILIRAKNNEIGNKHKDNLEGQTILWKKLVKLIKLYKEKSRVKEKKITNIRNKDRTLLHLIFYLKVNKTILWKTLCIYSTIR